MNLKSDMLAAITFFNQGKKKEALRIFEFLIQKNSFDKDLQFNYAFVLGNMGFYEKEQKAYESILSIYPEDVEALVNLAISSNETKNFDRAIQSSSRSIALKDDIPEAYEARGIAKLAINNISEGVIDLKKWVELTLKNFDSQKIEIFKKCIDLVAIPAVYQSSNQVLECRQSLEKNICFIEENLKKINSNDLVFNNIGVKIAFKLNHFYLAYQQKNDKDLNQRMSQIITILLNQRSAEKVISNKFKAKKKLGVISTFKYHPKLFIFDQLSDIDLDKFDIYIYVINNPNLNYPFLGSKFVTHFIEFNPDTYRKTIQFLESEDCDFIFMPDIGMSIESRILSVHNLAEQVFMNWLHPITSGSSAVTHFLSGQLMEDSQSRENYVEKLILFPGVGLRIDPKSYISVSEDEILNKINSDDLKIGCLQTPFKYHPDHDQLLVDIAVTIKNAYFYFIRYQDSLDSYLIERLKTLFKRHHLDPERIRLFDRMDKINYQNFLKTLDFSLDSIGWSGGNTTLDALGAALPVLTIPQSSMRSRHTSALYEMIDMKEFICTSYDNLVFKIDLLSKNPESLRNLRLKLLKNFSQLKTDNYFSNFINKLN